MSSRRGSGMLVAPSIGGADGGRASTAHVTARPATPMSGTAQRSARRTVAGPPATTAVDTTPTMTDQARSSSATGSMRAATEAAITLLTAIHAKLVTNSTA